MTEVYTPWAYEEELVQVRNKLYSKDPSQRRDAVDCIEMWTMRGNCPHAVSSSAFLTDALLQHDSGQFSSLTLRSLFGSAITRFVSGFCDIGQQSNSRTAMAEVAKLYGMPPAFIPLRHDITHRALPTLNRLVKASQEAIDWLWNYYWEPLDRCNTSAQRFHTLVSTSLKDYLDQRKKEVQSGSIDSSPAADACSVKLVEMDGSGKPLRNIVATNVVNMMIPRKRLVGDSMSGAFTLFDILLRTVGSQTDGLLSEVMSELTNRLNNDTNSKAGQQEGIACWIEHLLMSEQWTSGRLARQLQPWRAPVVQACALIGRGSSEWHARLLSALLDSAPSDFVEAQSMFRPPVDA